MIAQRLSLALPLAAAILLTACSKQPDSEKVPAKLEPTPPVFQVKFETSKGDFVVEVTREWAPNGADRFYELVRRGFYDGVRFFRVLPTFMVQFGINGTPNVQRQWVNFQIPDDPVKQSNKKGYVTFAMKGPHSRTTQVFINRADNPRLDKSGFSPFGRVTSGMEVVEQFYSGYGESYPRGNGPQQDLIQTQGNAYLEAQFPRLDYIKKATVLPAAR